LVGDEGFEPPTSSL